jgi:hypothetical protein
MEGLRKKLEGLDPEELKLVFELAEERLTETIATFNDQRTRLSEIIKFSIPVLGAILYQIFVLSEKCNCYEQSLIGLTFTVVFAVGIIIWAVTLYIPTEISVKGKPASKLLFDYEPEKNKRNLLVSVIIQYEKSIEHNTGINNRRTKHLTALTITIVATGSIAAVLYALALAI